MVILRWARLVGDVARGLAADAEVRLIQSRVGRFFRLEGSGHPNEIANSTFIKEFRAGLTTFATMAYILAVNSQVLAETGGNCPCDDKITFCKDNDVYNQCKIDFKRDLVTATALLSGSASIAFGLFTNLPVALAPGMGVNAYFAYQVVGFNGSGMVSYPLALTAVFVEGLIFMGLALTGMRQWLVRAIPSTIKTASGVGIGLFLTMVGLSYSVGIGAITGGVNTPLAIGGCRIEDLDSTTHMCTRGVMTNPAMWIGILLGGILVAVMMAFRMRSAIVIGIALVTVISWPRDTSFTYFPYTDEGNERFEFFKQVATFRPIGSLTFLHDWDLSGNAGTHFVLALFTFLYVDIIDCTATLASMAKFSNVVDDHGNFPRSTVAYCTDAAFISIGSFLGCSPVTAFIESASGIMQGGRTGLTAITTGICFLLAVFFAPIFASIPPWATGCTLILVGCMMIRQVVKINWAYIGDSLPSFVTLAFMPMSYSVAYGLIAGMLNYVVLNTTIWIIVHASGHRWVPENYHLKEAYHWQLNERNLPTWMRTLLAKIQRRRPEEDSVHKEGIDLGARGTSQESSQGIRGSSQFGGSTRDIHMANLQAQIRRFV
ncbi:hypothetical protein PFICI_08051 [Pestalotiopsis fici W106-1]|uniref:Xanthine/uracil permease n=1 Tax=Pestalotiopsis fici (strain W106-1 / CGMCC3.15140) TaxID=1229662 RepID=W3X528_PESFW|nr:uncharacterized protein PFICI_08051 [Pestalotiopsis fici W106-1]ETS80522.1 hypothetical protein PFICI_08051 [Pestalotiopsis fici W106-1]